MYKKADNLPDPLGEDKFGGISFYNYEHYYQLDASYANWLTKHKNDLVDGLAQNKV